MDPTTRFSNRVESYIKYRPSYPSAVVDLLQQEYGLSKDHEVADIGAGVGHSVRLVAPHVAYIYAVEPNQEMNQAMQVQLQQFSNVATRLTAAENT